MGKYDERAQAEIERDERIASLEARFAAVLDRPPVVVNIGELRGCIEGVEKQLEALYSRVSEEVARQATELGADIANEFAAARAGEMQELTERVAKLEHWWDEMHIVPDELAIALPDYAKDDDAPYDEESARSWGGRLPDDYEDPGPDSISPQG